MKAHWVYGCNGSYILSIPQNIYISVCSAQGQVFHWKFRHQGCNSAQTQVFHCKLRNQGCGLLRMNRCGSFPFLSASHSLSLASDQTLKGLKRSQSTSLEMVRVDLAEPCGLHRNSPQGLNISSIIYIYIYIYIYIHIHICAFYIDVSMKLNIGEVQRSRTSIYFSQ